MSKPRLKRVRYIPGIISAIFFPLLFISISKQHLKNSNLFGMTVVFADLNLIRSYPELFTRFNGHIPPIRTYQLIEFTGDLKSDLLKLKQIRSSLQSLVSSKDTLNGIHFRFGPKSEYQTFIKTIDVLRIEGVETYMPIDEDLWLYNLPPNRTQIDYPVEAITCGTSDATTILSRPNSEDITAHIEKAWLTSPSLIIAYCLFIGWTIFSIAPGTNKGA